MEEIKAPKKERKFLKAVGNIGKVLAEELVMGIARKFIGKVVDKVKLPKKRETLSILLLLSFTIAFAQFPTNTNKQRLGFQTTADGLVWRGSISDTSSIQPVSNQNAWVILDTVNLKIYSFDFTSNVWNQVGGGAFAQPIDSLFFKTSAPPNNVDTAKMRWDNELGTVVLGMYDAVPNEIGFKNFWLVKNQTGSTITKGSIVYANGTVGASGRITVAKFIANGTIDAKYLLGITAHDLTDGEDGYVISFGKIRQVNTDTFAAGAILYPSPTVAGVWTDVEPIAPNLDMPIGFCINSSSNNGTIAIRVASGYKLNELHDVAISSPVTNASLYYSGGLWRDTTAALLVSDTAAMLANYATKAYADTTGRLYARQDYSTGVTTSTLTWTQTDTLIPGGVTFIQVYRNGQILLPSQYTVPTSTSVVISASSFKVNDNYTVIFPRGGGAGSGGGSGSLTSISGGTGILVSPNPITTTGTVSADLSVLMELTDTSLLNLTTRFASKLNPSDTISLSNRIDAKGTGTVTSVGSGFGLLGGTITTTGTLRLDTSTIYARLQDSINVAIGNDTIKILKQEYQPALSSVLTWTITPKFPIQLKAYILVFRNGQLLNNDQYNLTDTNKITIVSTSFKVGANYTVATVSGIGSINTGVFPNPIYPDAGIALSTGSTWASSIPNNSSNWNTAFTDRLKWDGGSTDLLPSTGRTSLGGTTIGQSMFTLTNPSAITFPRFNADNTVSALTATNFRSAIGAGTVTTVNAATTSGNPISIDNNTTTPTIELLSATSARNGYLTSTDWTTFNNKQAALGFTPANSTITIATTAPLQGGGNLTANRTLSITQATTSVNGFLTSTDWNTFNNKVNISDTLDMLSPYFRDADTSLLNLTSRFAAKQNNITLTTTGTSGAATLIGSTLNIPQYSGGGGGTGTVTSVGLTAPSIFNVSGSPVTTSGTLALTYSGTALPLLNGGTGATTADGALTNLGATAQGKLLFGITNSVSDKFIKVNTNNTITLLNAADTRTAIGAGNISGVGSNSYIPIFSSSSYIGQSLLRWDGITIPNAKLINDYNFNEFTSLAGTGTRMVVASSTGLLSTQTIGSSVTSFSAGTTGFTPNTASTGVVTLGGILAITNGGTGANSASTARTALGATVRGSNVFTLPDIDQVSFIRYNANNTVSQRTAEGIRIDLGGTTLGQNMFMLTNPSAITFPRFNADNTVSALSAADFRTAIGVSSGGVSSVTASLPILSTGGTNPVISLDIKRSITVGTDFPNTNAQSSSDLTFTLTGVSVGQPVLLGVPDGSAPANTNYTAWVSAANTVKIRFNNYSSSAVNPSSGSFTISVINL
jgi:hypothetical protein